MKKYTYKISICNSKLSLNFKKNLAINMEKEAQKKNLNRVHENSQKGNLKGNY